jgi:hypothetical protein
MATATLKPIQKHVISFTIIGTSPLIQHRFAAKVMKQIRDKKLGKKTKERSVLDSEQEFRDAMHMTVNDEYGIPMCAFKASLINAAHKDIGIEKTLVKKSLFYHGGSDVVVPMKCDDPIMREDYVKVGMSGTDLRYRPEWKEWSVDIEMEFNADNLQPEDILTLVDLAGFGVGLHEMRPEKGGDNGRFKVDRTQPVNVEVLS